MIELRHIDVNMIEDYFAHLFSEYRLELLEAGYSQAYADNAIALTKNEALVEGKLTDGNFLFRAFSGAIAVGNLWLFRDMEGDLAHWMIYDIETFPEYRQQGFGRQILQAAETYVKSQGSNELSLHVFGSNAAARNLYESAGYEIRRINMKKSL